MEARKRIGTVVDRISSGYHAGAAEQFIETVALGPGAWARLPLKLRQTCTENAPTFLDEANDPSRCVSGKRKGDETLKHNTDTKNPR